MALIEDDGIGQLKFLRKAGGVAKKAVPYAAGAAAGGTMGVTAVAAFKRRQKIGAALGRALRPGAPGAPAAAEAELPPCGFFQRLSRVFGGKPDCA